MGDTAHRHIVFITDYNTLFSSKNKGRCLALLLLLKKSFFFENPKTYIYDEDPKLIKEKKRRVFVCVCFGFWTDKEDSLKKRPTKQRKANKRGA